MGRFMRFRAHLDEIKEFNFKKMCYENAFTSYERALTILESKKTQLWELVSFELSSGKFTLGKILTEHFKANMVIHVVYLKKKLLNHYISISRMTRLNKK